MGSKSFPTGTSTEDTTSRESLMDREATSGLMEPATMGLSSKDFVKEREFGSAKMETSIGDTLQLIGKMD